PGQRRARVEQRAEQHVPGHSGGRLQRQDHRSPFRAVRALRNAATAAPNPDSMSTTPVPAAQDDIIASSAVTPSSDAPYPTDVGTAITGAATSPPTTLARAPSMPATQ